MIQAIIFDCFGVLATDVWLAFCDQLPATADIKTARALNRAYDRGIITHDDFLQGVFDATGQHPPDIDRMELAKNTALLDYIGELKHNYKIGLLSNISNDWITRSFLTRAEQELFDTMVLSYETGLVKPDPAIYRLACERLGADPESVIMIDDREAYVSAARETGMHGIVYMDLSQLKHDLSVLLTR